jgi:thiol-disulfide isomerase/thioredoxin
MRKQILRFSFILSICLFSTQLVSVAQTKDEKPKNVITSIENANTADEIFSFVIQNTNKLRKEYDDAEQILIGAFSEANEIKLTKEKQRILREIGKIHLEAAEKIIKIAKDNSEKDKGLRLKIIGYKTLIQADLPDETIRATKKSEYQFVLEKFLDELDKEGRLPVEVSNERFSKLLNDDWFEVNKQISIEKFEEFLQKTKKLSTRKQAGYTPFEPLEFALYVANSNEWTTVYPQLYRKTVKDLIDFVNSENFNISDNDKKIVLDKLKGLALRTVGAKPEIIGKTVDNKDFSLSDFRGKYVLVNFTATWCSPCRAEIPAIAKLYEKYHDKGFEIASIYVWDKIDTVKEIVAKDKVAWIVISDELTEKSGIESLVKKFTIKNLPVTFIVDKDGTIIATDINEKTLESKLSDLFQTDGK